MNTNAIKSPFILLKASGMPMANTLEDVIKNNDYHISEIYNLSNGWEIIKNFYLNNPEEIEFNLEVEIHRWLEKYLFGESAYLIFIDTNEEKTFENKCQDALNIKREFRSKFKLSRDGTFIIALDVNKTSFKQKAEDLQPLLKWNKGKLKVSKKQFDPIIAQNGVFRGYYFKYAHTPDNVEEYNRHMNILTNAQVLTEENKVSPTNWEIIKSAVLGDTKRLNKLLKNQTEDLEM